MIFQDKNGRTWYEDELDALSPWEIEELGIHVADGLGRRVRSEKFAHA